ncbi:MAG TPA: hypothetical protein VGG98_04750 [Solirubrobacteraceae bacterium]
MRWSWLLVLLVLVTGIAGSVLALRAREGDTQFVAQQQAVVPVRAAQLDGLILTTADPRPGFGGRARAASCRSAAPGALGNPWTCVVRYPRLPRVRYRVIVFADRSIAGAGAPETLPSGAAPRRTDLTVRGCCVGGS